MSASFSTLPPHIHSRILTYVSTPLDFPLTFFSYLPPGSLKQEYRQQVRRYEALNRTWNHLIQAKLWSNICVAPSEIEQLQFLFTANPALASYVHSLKLRSPIRLPSDPPRPANSAAATSSAPIPFDETAGDTKEGLRIARIWSEVLSLINTHIIQHGKFKRLGVDVRLGIGREDRLVEFPRRYTLPVRRGGIKEFELVLPKAKRGDRLGMGSVERMVESVGEELEQLELQVLDGDVGERPVRREIYVGLTHLTSYLKHHLAPNLTSLNLSYLTFTPGNHSEVRIYSYTHADAGNDLLSRALRVLSKQLTSFTYIGGRISLELFHSTSDPTESAGWPYLKYYSVHFSPITSAGMWLFAFPDPSSPSYMPGDLRPRTPPSPPSDDEMSAADPAYVDPLADEYDYDAPRRYIPVRAVVDELFEAASRAMVPNMPVVEYWELGAQGIAGGGVGMGLRFDYEEGTHQPRITRGRAYEHSKNTMQVWEARFGAVRNERKRKRGEDAGGLVLVKAENAGMCGVSCMDEEDRRAWRGEESTSDSGGESEGDGEERETVNM